MSVRTLGQLVAGVMTAFVLLLLALAWRHSAANPGGNAFAPSSTASGQPGDDDIRSIVEFGEEAIWSRTDPETGRLEYRLEWSSLEPLRAGRFDVEAPRAFLYGDGVRAEISAERADLIWPNQSTEPPESGEMRGGVVVRVYEQTVEPGAEAAGGDPLVTVETDRMDFETALGELEAEGPIEVRGSGVLFRGRGLTVRISETRGRLQFGLIDRGEVLRVDPVALREADERRRRAAAATASSDGVDDEPGRRDDPPVAAFYEVLVRDGARLAQGNRSVRAEEMLLWVRLLDGRLSSDAIESFTFGGFDGEPAGGEDGTVVRTAPGSVDPSDSPSADQPIELVWQGPLEVRPLDTEPAALASESRGARGTGDHIAVQFRAPAATSPVVVLDEEQNLRLSGQRALYGFRTGRLEVDPLPGEPVRATVGDQVDVVFTELRANLRSGSIRADVAGEITVTGETESDEPATIAWERGASVSLERTSTGALSVNSVAFAGDVRGKVDGATLAGDFARAEFVDVDPSDVDRRALKSLRVEGDAELASTERNAGPDGTDEIRAAKARAIEIAFDLEFPAEPRPTRASASGGVEVVGPEGSLMARFADVEFTQDEAGDLSVLEVTADEEVVAESADGITLRGTHLVADARRETLELTGAPAELESESANGHRVVTGERMLMVRETREFIVYGPGEARAIQPDSTGTDSTGTDSTGTDASAGVADEVSAPPPVEDTTDLVYDEITLTWSRNLFVNDLQGQADATGDARIFGRRSNAEQHRAFGDRLILRYTPFDESGPERRELIAVQLEGEPFSRGDEGIVRADPEGTDSAAGRPARVESRFFGPDLAESDEPTLIALQGGEIFTEDETQTLRVPGPGLLLINDQRSPEDEGAGDAGATDEVETRGTSVFSWTGSMDVDRLGGRATMREMVRVRHLAQQSSVFTVLECERLDARFDPGDPQGETSDDAPRLRTIEADGGVYLKHGELEIVADSLFYSEAMGTATAQAAPGGRVSVHDGEAGQHFTAEAVEVDVITGQWRTVGASGRQRVR
ncbi:MAG: hypothetical protein AAGI30_02845 [Planctomycetota bacterium]